MKRRYSLGDMEVGK